MKSGSLVGVFGAAVISLTASNTFGQDLWGSAGYQHIAAVRRCHPGRRHCRLRLGGALIERPVEPCLSCVFSLCRLASLSRVSAGTAAWPRRRGDEYRASGGRPTLPLRRLERSLRRGDRVAEGGGLENRCAGNRTGGSNPSLSVFLLRSESPSFAALGDLREVSSASATVALTRYFALSRNEMLSSCWGKWRGSPSTVLPSPPVRSASRATRAGVQACATASPQGREMQRR